MEVLLLVSFRRQRVNPSILKPRRRWIRTADASQRLQVPGLYKQKPALWGLLKEAIRVFVLDDKLNSGVFFIIDPHPPELEIPSAINWSIYLQLKMDKPRNGQLRTLESKVTFSSYWQEPPIDLSHQQSQLVQHGDRESLAVDRAGQAFFPSNKSFPEFRFETIRPSHKADRNTSQYSVREMLEEMQDAILSEFSEPDDVIFFMEGSRWVQSLEQPWLQSFLWIRENLSSLDGTDQRSAKMRAKVLDAVKEQRLIYNALKKLLIDPFLASRKTVTKALADPLLEALRQLTTITESPNRMAEVLSDLQPTNWGKVLTCMMITNRVFFEDLIADILEERDSKKTHLLDVCRWEATDWNPRDRKFVSKALVSLQQEMKFAGSSNYLFAENCSIESMGGSVKVSDVSEGSTTFCQDICVAINSDSTLQLWKTTTAEDRARGKIYLRGFTKVDPVEDRLEISEIAFGAGGWIFFEIYNTNPNGQPEAETKIGYTFHYCKVAELYKLLMDRTQAERPLAAGPLLKEIPKFEFFRSEPWKENSLCRFDCSAALIAEVSLSPSTSELVLTYLKTDLCSKKFGKVREKNLSKELKLSGIPERDAGISTFPSLGFLCMGVSYMGSLKDLSRGISRRLGLFVFGWTQESDELKMIAKTVVEIREIELLTIPESLITHQVQKKQLDLVTFVRHKRNVFCIYSPPAPESRHHLMYYLHRDKFVPIRGNYLSYPGLYLLTQSEYMIVGRAYKSRENRLFVAGLLPSNTGQGRTYQFCKLILG